SGVPDEKGRHAFPAGRRRLPGPRKGGGPDRVRRGSRLRGLAGLGASGRPAGERRDSPMIRSDREIKLALAREHFRITPVPRPDQISSMSIDLTLDEELSVWNTARSSPGRETPLVSPNATGFDVTAFLTEHGSTFLMPA